MTDRYAVIGNPIAHSKSPDIHARFAAQTRQDMHYDRLLAPLAGFADAVHAFMHEGGRGANITVPFKLEAYALAHELSERARSAGAVNTLSFDSGKVRGDNTDGVGLVTDIVQNAGVTLAGKRILLLGAGGAARGVMLPLLKELPGQLVITNRTASRAHELIRQFNQPALLRACEFSQLQGCFDVIINATSASLTDELPPLPAGLMNETTLAYDMMYGKAPTAFMRFASLQSAMVRDGLGMLVEQAAESFFIWRGMRPETASVFSALRAQLQS